jgi:hypothetical protein
MECEAKFGKDESLVPRALHKIEARTLFKLLALYCDNGCDFLNQNVVEFYAKMNRFEAIKLAMPERLRESTFVERKSCGRC